MLTNRNLAIRNLRRCVRDETQPPLTRLDAAHKLIERFGASERNSAALRTRIKALMRSPDRVISARAHDVRDLLVARLEAKPALRIIQTLTTNLSDDADGDMRHTPKPPRSYSRTRLVIPQPPDDGYKLGTVNLEGYVTRLKAAAGTFRLCDWTARLRVALAIGETDPIDWELVSQISLALSHEPEINGMSSLGSVISGHAYANQLPLPRPSVDLMTELERRS